MDCGSIFFFSEEKRRPPIVLIIRFNYTVFRKKLTLECLQELKSFSVD